MPTRKPNARATRASMKIRSCTKNFVILGLLAVVASAAGAQTRPPTGERPRPKPAAQAAGSATQAQVDKAEDAIGRNDFAAAEPLLKAAAAANPKDYRAWYDLG